jgi:hypothetical protein
MSQDVYSAGFTPTQTVELQSMFQKCGFSGADWIDIPAWFMYTTQLSAGQVLAGEKQSAGSASGADFYLRRLQLINATTITAGVGLPMVYSRILCPNGHYLSSGNLANAAFGGPFMTTTPSAGTLMPGPLGLVKPEVHCPAGSNFTIDMINVTPSWVTGGGESVVFSIVFEGVYRFRLKKAC